LRLGEAYANASKFDEGQEQLEAGLALLGEPPPLSVAQQGFSLFKQLARQARHRLWPKRYIGRLASRAENLREIARAYERLTEVYFFKNAVFSGLCAAFTSLNSAELAGPSPELARAYAPIGAIFGMAPWHGVAEAYCQHALQLAQSLNNLPARIWVDISAGVYYSGVGRWDEARQLFDEVLSLSERLGDRRRWDDGATNLVMLNYCLGEWQHGFKLAQAFYQSASRRGDLANQTWALFEQAYLLLAREAPTHPEVQATVQRLREVTEAQKNLDETTRINVYGLFAWHATLLGQAEPALAMFEKAYAVVIKSQPTFYHAVLGYMATFETALYWHAQEPCRVELKNKLPALLKALKSFANVFPVGRAYLHYYQGWVNVRAGRRPAALASWRAALASAQKLTMPYLQGLAYAALGQHLPSEAADRVAHQRQAQTIFEALGAARGRQV
jgi:tetratricopeptide (TPR) repeat protein